MSKSLITKKENGVLYLYLNRPKVYNGINQELSHALISQINAGGQDEEIRVIVITAKGKVFCSGQDLKEVKDIYGKEELSYLIDKNYTPLVRAITEVETPVIVAVNGVAAGAGASLALASDLCVASEGASFVQAFVGIGLLPDTGSTYFLPRMVGHQRAMSLAMLGEKITSKDALGIGIVSKLFSESTFETDIQNLAKKIAAMPTQALIAIKKAIRTSHVNTLEEQLELEKQFQAKLGKTHDFKEGFSAFLEKRNPKFIGK